MIVVMQLTESKNKKLNSPVAEKLHNAFVQIQWCD